MAEQQPLFEPAPSSHAFINIIATVFKPKTTSNSDGENHVSEKCLQELSEAISTVTPARLVIGRTLEPTGRVVEALFALQRPVSIRIFDIRRQEAILAFEEKWNVTVVIQKNSVFRKNKRLAVFDMDSTLIQQEVIDEIARKIGVEKEVSAITARAMNGELDFTASLRERCRLLKGVPSSVFEELKSVITLTPGAADLVRALKRLGFKTAVLSGGFTPLCSWMAERLGLDYAYANHLVISEDGKSLTGEVEGDIVHAEMKREHVLRIAKENRIALDQVLVVGDGANDLPMLGVAGLGVAFNAKPKVQLAAPARLNSDSLLDVLYLLGLTRAEVDELLQVM